MIGIYSHNLVTYMLYTDMSLSVHHSSEFVIAEDEVNCYCRIVGRTLIRSEQHDVIDN